MYFSICIPSYNRAHTISRTLDSLVSQNFKDFEVLVVDDGSSDNTEEIVSSYKNLLKLNYYKKINGGKHSALNVGIENARGIFFMVLDSDDWLVENALDTLYLLCKKIETKKEYCGVLCRSIDASTNKLVGDEIPDNIDCVSYIDMHFRLWKKGINLEDCCECNKTEILKMYRFPEQDGMKFVPEAWLFDQIGIDYVLLASNSQIKYIEYLQGGITLDTKYKEKNNLGFLYHYTSRIENILPNVDHTIKDDIIAWWRYWQSVSLDKEKKGPRVKKISLIGYFVKYTMPIINIFYRIRYKELYKKGR